MRDHLAPSARTLLAIDGNSLTHRAYHAYAQTGFLDSRGNPAWAIKGFWQLLLGIMDRVNPDALVVGFDDASHSRRKIRFPHYKSQRKPKDPALVAQLAALPPMLQAAGITVMVPEGLEADDVMAAAARHASWGDGWRCVIATSDRDAFGQISPTTSVLRLINGGLDNAPLLNPDRFRIMMGFESYQYLDFAALRGDASDNLSGVHGIGTKTATALLAAFPTMRAVWEDLDSDAAAITTAAGRAAVTKLRAAGAREAWETNRLIMTPATSLTLPGTAAGTVGALPLDDHAVAGVLHGAGVGMLAPSAVQRLCVRSDLWSSVPGSVQAPLPRVQPDTAAPGPPASAQSSLF